MGAVCDQKTNQMIRVTSLSRSDISPTSQPPGRGGGLEIFYHLASDSINHVYILKLQ